MLMGRWQSLSVVLVVRTVAQTLCLWVVVRWVRGSALKFSLCRGRPCLSTGFGLGTDDNVVVVVVVLMFCTHCYSSTVSKIA